MLNQLSLVFQLNEKCENLKNHEKYVIHLSFSITEENNSEKINSISYKTGKLYINSKRLNTQTSDAVLY